MEIGIPRALLFYTYFPFWYGFLKELGIKNILSDKTTKKTVSEGASLVVSETCLPIKIYIGHVLNLISKGVKNIFVPSIQSIAPKIYNCSKIRGLPDLVRNVIKDEINVIESTYDMSEKFHGLHDFYMEIAKQFNITDKKRIKNALRCGQKLFNNFKFMTNANVPYNKAIDAIIADEMIIPGERKDYPLTVAVIAHGYNLYDEKSSMNILNKLEKMNVGTKTSEDLSFEEMSQGVAAVGSKLYWANEFEITGASGKFIQDKNIDGIIVINAFGCGPDSLMVERIHRFSKQYNKPFLNLSIDEHTGEAGFITRIEAFCDMIIRKKRSNKKYKKETENNRERTEGIISEKIMEGIRESL